MRELVDTFFHELTHVFLNLLGSRRKQGKREEALACWVGYLAKTMFSDYDKNTYGK